MLTIGEILKKERIKKNISLNEIEKKTKIRKRYLLAIEENNWRVFPSKIYIEGVIKNYALSLGLSYKKILAFFRRDYGEEEVINFKKKLNKNLLIPESKKNFILITIFFVLFLLGYFGYQFTNFLLPPSIIFLSPKQEVFTKENKITLKAKVKKDTIVNIFGQRVYQDKEGIFFYEVPLQKGKNEIEIELIGANGKKRVVKKIFYKK